MPTKAFQSTPPARGATTGRSRRDFADEFQSTPPARGATWGYKARPSYELFQSTPPARGATGQGDGGRRDLFAISIHAPREGGDYTRGRVRKKKKISIHAPREGGDGRLVVLEPVAKISIHAPREGGDSKNSQNFKLFLQQSDNSYKYPLPTPAIFQK